MGRKRSRFHLGTNEMIDVISSFERSSYRTRSLRMDYRSSTHGCLSHPTSGRRCPTRTQVGEWQQKLRMVAKDLKDHKHAASDVCRIGRGMRCEGIIMCIFSLTCVLFPFLALVAAASFYRGFGRLYMNVPSAVPSLSCKDQSGTILISAPMYCSS
ncbi:unnamed protein product [Gordionus sp. m RMFG-2023]